jgi:Uma2 family endonuclease
VPDKPPLIAIEVLSPDDRMRAVENKLKEYKDWGIPHVWLVDPDSRRMYVYEDKLNEVATLPLPEFETEVTSADIFRVYDLKVELGTRGLSYSQSMGVRTAISIEEYLHTSYEGTDREFRDGEVVERSMPDYPHGKCQGLVVSFFNGLRKKLRLYPCTETRMRLSGKRVLIPDVAVFHQSEPGYVPDSPPLIAIEVLSPDDRLREVQDKLQEYRARGVPHIWLVDPRSRRLWNYGEELKGVEALGIPELDIEITPADIFD